MIWQQNHQKAKTHYKTYPKMKKKRQIITCVMFDEIQKRCLETIKGKTIKTKGSGHQTKKPFRTGLKNLKP